MNAKSRVLTNAEICSPNRLLFKEFFKYQEYKLCRLRRLPQLDERCYKTLYNNLTHLRIVNRWFDNKPWADLSHEDIKNVYDAVEENRIVKTSGHPFENKDTYYHRILRGKPFELAGKADIVKKVMEFHVPLAAKEPAYIPENVFRKMLTVVPLVKHRLFLWLCWDIGENGASLLLLRKSDCEHRVDKETGEAEYWINLRKDILKRSRLDRVLPTNYHETVDLLDITLRDLRDDEALFDFGERMGAKIVERAARLTQSTCKPDGGRVRLKDLRSSMANDLLEKGWTTDEVNLRLGHVLGSPQIKRYANARALNQRRPKERMRQQDRAELRAEVEVAKHRVHLASQRERSMQTRIDELQEQMDDNNRDVHAQLGKLALVLKRRPA